MTSYSVIGNGEIDAESPLTESLFFRLRDNLLAIQEGDVSAPKIAGIALADLAVITAKLADEAVTAAKVAPETLTGGVGGNVAAGTLTAYNMDPAAAGFLFDADGGWCSLVSGVLLQWVKIPPLAFDDSTTVSWKTPFLSTVGFAIASIEVATQATVADNVMHVVSGYTLTQITLRNEGFAGGASATVGGWVFAIGL